MLLGRRGIAKSGQHCSILNRMGWSAFRFQLDRATSTFWRRRLLVMCTGLAVLAVFAWTASTVLRAGLGTTAGAAGRARTASPAHSAAGPAPPSVTRSVAGAAAPIRGVRPPYCGWRNIVLSLFSEQTTFGPGQLPTFSVNVVSTAPADCSYNLGSKHLVLVIREGPVRIWSSADCAPAPGDLLSALKRGVPTSILISWNRQTSSPGCSGPANQAPAGTYTVFARQGSVTTAPISFRLN